MQVLLVTHASRPFVEARASLNALENRFSAKDRLTRLPPLNSLPSVHEAVPFAGMLTMWDIDDVGERNPVLIGEYAPDFKLQSAAFRGDQMLVLGEDRIEVLSAGFRLEKTIEDPWLVGGHTLYCDNAGFTYATSAPANSVLKIDVAAGKVVERIRLPDTYGIGYALTEDDDLRSHFVPTDLQPTHINSAVPCADGLLVTLCIPGVVGVIAPIGHFREIVKGYRGCHGGRIDNTTGLLYFADSPAGMVWFADYKTGQIVSRIKIDTAWLHDAEQVGAHVFAVALSDHNRIEMVSRLDGSVIATLDCHPYGASAMFVRAAALPDTWLSGIAEAPVVSKTPDAPAFSGDVELLADPLNPVIWMGFSTQPATISSALFIASDSAHYEYLAEGPMIVLPPGDYVFDADLVCKAGEAAVGLLDDAEVWLAQLIFDASNSTRSVRFSLSAPSSAVVVIAGHNSRRACPVLAKLKRLSLKHLGAEQHVAPTVEVAALHAIGHRRAEIEYLQSEVNKRDVLLKETAERLQSEVNKRDALLKATHDHLQAEVNKRDEMLAELQHQLNEFSRP